MDKEEPTLPEDMLRKEIHMVMKRLSYENDLSFAQLLGILDVVKDDLLQLAKAPYDEEEMMEDRDG